MINAPSRVILRYGLKTTTCIVVFPEGACQSRGAVDCVNIHKKRFSLRGRLGAGRAAQRRPYGCAAADDRLSENDLIRHGFAVPPSPKGEGWSAGRAAQRRPYGYAAADDRLSENDLIRPFGAPFPKGKAGVPGGRRNAAPTVVQPSMIDFQRTTSSVTASPCHLPLKGKAWGPGGRRNAAPTGSGRQEWRPYGSGRGSRYSYCLLPIPYCLFPVAYSLFPVPCSLLPNP